MGLLVNGQWQDTWYESKDGRFHREDSLFRHWITETGETGFKAESGRYHLYVSLACPWAHRTLIVRKLKGLEQHVGVTVVEPKMLDKGWALGKDTGPIQGITHAYEIYKAAKNDYTGRVTVPILWDTQENTIVNNESSEIIRMFNSAFNGLTGNTLDLYPAELRKEIDALNAAIYPSVNNGVYRAGFATTQATYEEAVYPLFEMLETLDQRLANQVYLTGDQLTEADVRLFTTLIRFDAVYVGHFKCNLKMIEQFNHLPRYLRRIYQHSGIHETVDFAHIKQHYYYSHTGINPTQVVPAGPVIDYFTPTFQ